MSGYKTSKVDERGARLEVLHAEEDAVSWVSRKHPNDVVRAAALKRLEVLRGTISEVEKEAEPV